MIRILALGAAMAVATPAYAAELTDADRHALQQLAERMDHAWTVADEDANAQLFASGATARFGDEALGEGREAIRDQFRRFFKDRPAGLRHTTMIERVELLAPDLAMWDAEVRVQRRQPDGEWVTLTRIQNSTVIVRHAQSWQIKSVRAFPVQ